MIKAYLTIDDVTTSRTHEIVDFLNSKSITPIMFCWGEHLLAHPDEAIYALQHGVILQNHSYSHPQFSELSLWKAKREIMKNEKILASLYKKAGVERPYKLFRFPYGNNGGKMRKNCRRFLYGKTLHILMTALLLMTAISGRVTNRSGMYSGRLISLNIICGKEIRSRLTMSKQT